MVGVSLVVLIVAQSPNPLLSVSFERAARGALGRSAEIELVVLPSDPPDEESVARVTAERLDGVIELSWSSANQARLHCYLAREQRWVDREIDFGSSGGGSTREAAERGRLLGFAVATMFTTDEDEDEDEDEDGDAVPPERKQKPRLPQPVPPTRSPALRVAPSVAPGRSLEFAGVLTSGVGGTASGLGASAALRLAWLGPVSARVLLSGRAGSIPEAQAATRTFLAGVGLSVALLPAESSLQLGARLDTFASYFAASHLSEDDVAPDTQSRWLPGAALLGELGVQLGTGAGVFLGAGLEALAGRTDVFTHGARVAVLPPVRAVGELGFRAPF